PWKTFVYDLGMYCTFYLRNHLEHLRRQKYMDPQIYLDLDVQKRQAERFTKEITKRKRKQREQEQSCAERTHAILRCFKELRLKAELSVMEECTNYNNNSSNSNKNKASRKSLDDIMYELKTVVVPRVERLKDLNFKLISDGVQVDKLRLELDLKTRKLYDEFVLAGSTGSSSEREKIFEASVKAWYSSITNEDFLCCELEPSKFLRDARDWWAKRCKKPPPEKCGELYLARLRKRQLLLKKEIELAKTQENWSTNYNNNSSNSNKNKASRKSLDDIMYELKTVVVPRVERLKDLNFKLISDGVQVDKLRLELDLKTRKLYDEFVLAGSTGSSSEREKIFEASVKAWYSSITNEDFLCCELEPSKFLRDARDWWAKRCKKPPPEKCGELYLARLRKRQLLLKKEIELAKTQENWRRQLLERKLREKIDWYFTELPIYVAELRKFYEKNLERRLLNKEIFWMKGIPAQYDLLEPPERLKHMYCEYEDFIKNYDGFCSTEDGYCGCLEYAAKDIVRANTVLRRKEWMDMELRQYPEINYKGPEQLLCPEAREEYYYSARNPSVPKRAAVKFIARAEDFMKKLLKEVPTFSPELITAEARASYKRFLGIVSDFYNPPRRPCSWTAFSSSCYYYEVHTNSHQDSRSNIRQTIRRIKDCEDSRLSRLEKVDSIARKHRLVSNLWNKSVIKRPLDGVSFQTRVRWISSNTWFSLNQLAQSWIYDEELSPLSQLEPFIKENVRQMEKENQLNEDPDFFLGGTYEISAIFKVSSLYKAHVEDVKIGIDPDKVVRQVIDLIKDVKTGVISKSSLIAVNAATTNTVNVGTNTITTLTTIANTSRNTNNINSIGINSIFNNINASSSSNTSS
ncbi:2633_t:CDS:2, partial [Entrophospora sp. SA101]